MNGDTSARLFDLPTPRHPAGRLRKGLDAALKATTVDLDPDGVAGLRILADQIDKLERHCRGPESKPYDTVPLVGLFRQWEETRARVFAVATLANDPLAAALADFAAATARNPAQP